MLNYAIFGGTPGQPYPYDNVKNFDFGHGGGLMPVVQPPYDFNIAHVYPTSKIKSVVDLIYINWDAHVATAPYAQRLWNLIDWLYLIDPNAYVQNLQISLAPHNYGAVILVNPPIPFPGKIFFKR